MTAREKARRVESLRDQRLMAKPAKDMVNGSGLEQQAVSAQSLDGGKTDSTTE